MAGTMNAIDPFRQRQADLMWCGMLVTQFSDHELRLLGETGFLSEHDRDLIRQAGRGEATHGWG